MHLKFIHKEGKVLEINYTGYLEGKTGMGMQWKGRNNWEERLGAS